MENDQVKLLWDFRIQTDHHLDHNRPDIVVLKKASKVCQIIDVACPFDTRIAEKEREKINQWKHRKCGTAKAHLLLQIVIVALGAVTKNLMMWVSKPHLHVLKKSVRHGKIFCTVLTILRHGTPNFRRVNVSVPNVMWHQCSKF